MFRSTDVPRVYQSAEALAVGLFPKIVHGEICRILASRFPIVRGIYFSGRLETKYYNARQTKRHLDA